MCDPVFAFFSPGPMEMLIVAMIAVLLFGKRLPEVGRSLGKGLMEFKKGMQGIEDEIGGTVSDVRKSPSASAPKQRDAEEPAAPKFELPASEPTETTQAATADSNK